MREFATFAVKLLAVGERAIHVRRVVTDAEAIIPLVEAEEVTLEPPELGSRFWWQMTMPMNAAKECGLVE